MDYIVKVNIQAEFPDERIRDSEGNLKPDTMRYAVIEFVTESVEIDSQLLTLSFDKYGEFVHRIPFAYIRCIGWNCRVATLCINFHNYDDLRNIRAKLFHEKIEFQKDFT